MEMQNRENNGGYDGVQQRMKEGEGGKGGGGNGGWAEMGLRVLALMLTLIAAILLGLDKQTKIVPISISPDLPPFSVPVTAKAHYLSAFVFFVVANSVACAFTAVSLAISLASKGGGRGGSLMTIFLMDLIMLSLLFSSVGAAGAVGMLGFKGNSHVRWNKVCNVYGKFCHQVMAAVFLSFLGGIVYVLLVLLSALNLPKRP